MLPLRARLRQKVGPTLVIRRTPATRWPIEWTYHHWAHFSGGHVFERRRDELMALAVDGRLYQGARYRGVARATDLLCACAAATDRPTCSKPIVDLGYGIVREEDRHNRYLQVTTASALADRAVFDGTPALAAVSVTAAGALGAQVALLRAGAKRLTLSDADLRHPDLGQFYRDCIARGAVSGMRDPILWLFGEDAIKYQLSLVLEACSEAGLPWGAKNKVTVRVDGDLAHWKSLEVLERMVTGALPLPFEVLW